MQFQKLNNSFIVYVEKGEKVMETLTNFCIENNIHSGQLAGIGAVKNIDIGGDGNIQFIEFLRASCIKKDLYIPEDISIFDKLRIY